MSNKPRLNPGVPAPGNPESTLKPARWKVVLRHFFSLIQVELIIGLLVLISVALTLVEFSIESDPGRDESLFRTIILVNDMITLIFVIELSLRYMVAESKRKFFGEFWLDILATLPLFRIFRAGRALRLLRLVRIFRLFGVVSRLKSHYPYIVRQGAWDFLVVCAMLIVAVIFGTVAMMYFENAGSPNSLNANSEFSMENSFWYSMYTLFAGEPIPGPPKTLAGRITTIFIMFMGLTIFAIFAGTVSAFMVDRLRVEGRVANFDELENHIVICGWSNKTEIIIREFRACPTQKKVPILVITEQELDEIELPDDLRAGVMFMHDDFTRMQALERAGIRRAVTCLIMSDATGGRSEQDADARTILAALTVEKMNESVFTCAELINSSYGSHLEMGHVNEFVVSGEYSAYMLAQAAMNRGLLGVLNELMTLQRGNEFFRVPVTDHWVGKSFFDLLIELKQDKDAILVGVYDAGGQLHLNPHDYQFREGDEIVAISQGPISLGPAT